MCGLPIPFFPSREAKYMLIPWSWMSRSIGQK
jgi:hypothetical protein